MTTKKRRGRQEKVFARRDDDECVVVRGHEFDESLHWCVCVCVCSQRQCTKGVREPSPQYHALRCQDSALFYIVRTDLALFHLERLKCTPQLVVYAGRPELVYRECDKTPCALLVRACR